MTDLLTETAFKHIRDPDWLRARGLFVAEGRYVARRLIQSPRFRTAAILLSPTAHAAMADTLDGVEPARRPRVFVRPQTELDAVTGFRLHQGCVALGARPPITAAVPSVLGGPLVVLERVRDPDNVGSIIRTAAGLGAGGLLLGPECADPFYRKAVRTSMGAVFVLPLATASKWPEALSALKAEGRLVVALTPGAASCSLAEARTRVGDRPVAFLLGSEGEGLTPGARALADMEATIPMTTLAESLNVAVATAVALYAWRTD